jgi:hypothetical protein
MKVILRGHHTTNSKRKVKDGDKSNVDNLTVTKEQIQTMRTRINLNMA